MLCVSKTVKIPDPVYERISREAEQRDVARGVIVRDWMDKADELENLQRR